MRYATQAAIEFALREHERAKFQVCPERLAQAWGTRIIPGKDNRASAGPPSIITLKWDQYAPRQRFTMHHELAHIVVQRSGLEDDIRAEVDEEDAEAHLERVVSHIASLLVTPAPLVERVSKKYGDTPQMILSLARAARISIPAAMFRYVHHDQDARRAAFITSGSYVRFTATCNTWLPIRPYDRVPEVGLVLPEAKLRRIPKRDALVGVVPVDFF